MNSMQQLFDQISACLKRGAKNYTVFLRLYHVPITTGADDLQLFVSEAFGANAEVGGTEVIAAADVITEMDSLLRFAGDTGSGPNASVLESTELSDLLAELNRSISALVLGAKRIERFWLSAGHPAYPVFWDFAYLVLKDESATLLLGSSSD